MLLTCPQCETISSGDRLRLHPAGQPVHCMICDHIWTARLLTSGDRQDMPDFASYFNKFGLPVIAVLICAGLMTSLIKGRGILTWSGHAAPLRVRVTRPDGVILNETIIRPDDRIIAANQQSPFFVQLDIDSGAKAEVSVIPISRPIFD